MKRWWVVIGHQSFWFSELKDAKGKARKYFDSQIFEYIGNYKFLRFYEKNGILKQA